MSISRHYLRRGAVFVSTASLIAVGLQVGVDAESPLRSLRDPFPITEGVPFELAEERTTVLDEFSYLIPTGFEEFLDSRDSAPQSDGGPQISVASQTLRRKVDSAVVVVSATDGIDAADELRRARELEAEIDETSVAGELALIWTEELTGQRGLAWALDDDTLGWVFADRVSDEDMITFAEGVQVEK